jgi:hypothetical protein
MPSHIFTRLGLWEDSIASNVAARVAAHQQGDTGEELHGMDYLVYAYLQSGREKEAALVVRQLRGMSNSSVDDFKAAYAFYCHSGFAMQSRGGAGPRPRPLCPQLEFLLMLPQSRSGVGVWGSRGAGTL